MRLRERLCRLEWMCSPEVIARRIGAYENREERPRHLATVHSLNRATTTTVIRIDRPDVRVYWSKLRLRWIVGRTVVFEQRGRLLRRLPDWPHATPPSELLGRTLITHVICD